MSDSYDSWFAPTGRKVEGPDQPKGWLGTVGTLQKASPERLQAARRNLRELEEVTRVEKHWVDSDGEEYELVRGLVDFAVPQATGTTAFVVEDGMLVPLRVRGTEVQVKSTALGTLTAGRVG